MTDLSKEEVHEALSSTFWKEVAAKLDEEKSELEQELLDLDFITESSLLTARSLKTKIEAIDKLFEKIEDIKEELPDG